MPIDVLKGAYEIAKQSIHVRTDDTVVSALAREFKDVPPPAWDTELHFTDGTEKTLMYTLLLDAVNFCFWPSEFTVTYRGKTYGQDDGYCALAVGLKRAFEEGMPLWDPRTLADIATEDFAAIFRGDGEVPLMEKRLANARNVGATLVARYGGDVKNVLAAAGNSAPRLARKLAGHFRAYEDSRTYRGKRYDILKRAQLCAADIHGSFGGRGLGALSDVDQLTCFADYKLPQLFHSRGIFAYAPALEARILAQERIPENSEEEVEIRANTIVAVEKLKQALVVAGRPMSARQIDWLLWNESVKPGSMTVPHHRTLTTSY